MKKYNYLLIWSDYCDRLCGLGLVKIWISDCLALNTALRSLIKIPVGANDNSIVNAWRKHWEILNEDHHLMKSLQNCRKTANLAFVMGNKLPAHMCVMYTQTADSKKEVYQSTFEIMSGMGAFIILIYNQQLLISFHICLLFYNFGIFFYVEDDHPMKQYAFTMDNACE